MSIPLPRCVPVEERPDGEECAMVFDERSASVAGRATRDPCSHPRQLPTVRLTERYPRGGAVVWEWKTDWEGEYHFAGLEPGSSFLLEFVGYPDAAIRIPALAPGERYFAPPVSLRGGCAPEP